ncbi:MAG: hypothetical protein JJU20_03170 [Opitutales bacterium]|nr:hypothetical protein [Opitutales bacterium]
MIIASTEERRTILNENPETLIGSFSIDRLASAINQLISENQKVAARGQAYLNQIEATLGNLREAVLIIDDENFIRLSNLAFRQLIDRTQNPIGSRLEAFIQGPDFIERLGEMKAGVSSSRAEVEAHIGSRRRWLEISSARLPQDQQSSQRLTLFVFHDITRQKNLERMRTEFVANVSHELRTPVTVIKGFAETLQEDYAELDDADRLRFLDRIISNSKRLNNLIQDLLLISRLEASSDALSPQRQSLHAIIRECAENVETRLKQGQRIEYQLEAQEETLYVDNLRISQVVTNLLENALRHGRGLTTLKIHTYGVEEGIVTAIEDDGCGIPSKDLPFIFQRFYRVDKSRSRESGGTGLGLSIVKHIIQQHGGDIRAESEYGSWTRMSFFLPYPGRMAENAVFSAFRKRPRYFDSDDPAKPKPNEPGQ